MRITTVFFDADSTGKYKKLYEVFKYSALKNVWGDVNFRGISIPAPDLTKHSVRACVSNSAKLKEWVDELDDCKDNIAFMDCDMIIIRDISTVFQQDFDIAVTRRAETSKLPINGGVVFVKPTKASKEFMQLWYDVNMRMFNDVEFHNPWRAKYGGMNQAALGYILEQEKFKAKVIQLPCNEWNSCDDNWEKIDINTRIIHIKGRLRRMCLGEMPVTANTYIAHNHWSRLHEELTRINQQG